MDLKNVLMRERVLKYLSAEQEVAGIVSRMEATLYRNDAMETLLMHVLYRHGCVIFSDMGPYFSIT